MMIDFDLLPHKGGLSIEHNPYCGMDQPIREYIEDNDIASDFENAESMEIAVSTDSLWIMQWYPDTPVGFCRVAGPTLQDILRLATKTDD